MKRAFKIIPFFILSLYPSIAMANSGMRCDADGLIAMFLCGAAVIVFILAWLLPCFKFISSNILQALTKLFVINMTLDIIGLFSMMSCWDYSCYINYFDHFIDVIISSIIFIILVLIKIIMYVINKKSMMQQLIDLQSNIDPSNTKFS